MIVRQLEDGDDVADFSCGHDSLDTWIRTRGVANKHHFGNIFVAVDEGKVLGYVTLMGKHVRRERIGGSGPEDWPVLLIARLAVRRDIQSSGVGKPLMRKAYEVALNNHYIGSGCTAVVVDAKTDTDPPAPGYYAKFVFKEFRPDPNDVATNSVRMFLKIKNVVKMMEAWAAAEAKKATG